MPIAVALVVALLVGLLGVGSMPAAAAIANRDCGDSSTQRAAQIFFLKHGGPHRDPHRLDADGDGIACESLPCPCYFGKDQPDDEKPPEPKQLVQPARVISVTDGDTIKVRLIGGPRRYVRLVGIDTPEVYGGEECGGPQASMSMKRMLPRGTRVVLRSDPSQDFKDRYDRLLRYVTKASNKRDINRAQIYRGWAKVYVYDNNPFKRVKSYRTAQSQAKKAHRGIWGRC